MLKEYTFTTRHSPTNDLYELDLEEHMHQMAKMGREKGEGRREKGQRYDKVQPG